MPLRCTAKVDRPLKNPFHRMPYKSSAQRRFFHSAGAKKADITASQVKEFDSASKGKKLPEKIGRRSLKHTRLPKKKG